MTASIITSLFESAGWDIVATKTAVICTKNVSGTHNCVTASWSATTGVGTVDITDVRTDECLVPMRSFTAGDDFYAAASMAVDMASMISRPKPY